MSMLWRAALRTSAQAVVASDFGIESEVEIWANVSPRLVTYHGRCALKRSPTGLAKTAIGLAAAAAEVLDECRHEPEEKQLDFIRLRTSIADVASAGPIARSQVEFAREICLALFDEVLERARVETSLFHRQDAVVAALASY